MRFEEKLKPDFPNLHQDHSDKVTTITGLIIYSEHQGCTP